MERRLSSYIGCLLGLAAGDARQMQRFLECLRLPGRERQADISY